MFGGAGEHAASPMQTNLAESPNRAQIVLS
jgi:hypothetical protein